MLKDSITRFENLLDFIPAKLAAIPEKEFSHKPNGKWSKKEILGHLIDSATNNHQRFVRLQFEREPLIGYDADLWVAHGYYQLMDSMQIIDFWSAYNRQLLSLMKTIPEAYSGSVCRVGENKVTLEFLMGDYVVHLEHHLEQILGALE